MKFWDSSGLLPLCLVENQSKVLKKLVGEDDAIVAVGDAVGGRQVPGNMFVPIDLLKPILGNLIAQGKAGDKPRPWLGVNTQDLQGKLMVTRVSPDSPADKAGLAAGDIILGVRGEQFKGHADFYKKIWSSGDAGAEIELNVLKGTEVQKLLFGAKHEIVSSGRAATAQTPGGTGGLRVAADFIKKLFPHATVWLSEPTWPNHPQIFQAAGLAVKTYPYYDYAKKTLAFGEMKEALAEAHAGDVVLFHACCHNPSGMDPDAAQWAELAKIVRDRKCLPLFDFAYQGFAEGLDEDAAGLRAFCAPGAELLVCSSFSKNFGLYNERVGALTVVAADKPAAAASPSSSKPSDKPAST